MKKFGGCQIKKGGIPKMENKYTKFYLNGQLIEEKNEALAVTIDEFKGYATNAFPELSNASYETDEDYGTVYFTSRSKKDGLR